MRAVMGAIVSFGSFCSAYTFRYYLIIPDCKRDRASVNGFAKKNFASGLRFAIAAPETLFARGSCGQSPFLVWGINYPRSSARNCFPHTNPKRERGHSPAMP